MKHVTFVKKILKDGSPCRKCADVEERIQREGIADQIDETLIADERDDASPGMQLAAQYDVSRAPFFIVKENDDTRVYTVFMRFLKDEIRSARSPTDVAIARDILDSNPDLDLV